MSDEPLKKPGARLAKKPTLDQLQAELSADLKTGEDALFYDWTRVADAPPSEAAYVPPMQIQTLGMDTRNLAAIIGREAAEAARHAPSPGQSVVIDERDATSGPALEIETFGDSIPTVEMPGGPISDDRNAVTRRLSAVGQRGRSGWIWVAIAIGAVLGCVAFVWTQRGSDSSVMPTLAPSNNAAASTSTTRAAVATPSLPASTTPTAVPVAEVPPDAVKPQPPAGTSPRKVGPSVVQPPEHPPTRRSPASGSTMTGRPPSTPQTAPTKPEVADPLLVENPGY